MSMLARYKKGGGIIELVKLIEDSPEPKRSQLLSMIKQEDPDFAARVEARIFSYDQFKKLPDNLIAEIISASAPKIVAIAMSGESDTTFITLVERCLGQNFAEYKSEKEILAGQPANAGQLDAARKKIISEARKLEGDGKIKLPNNDPGESPAGTKPASATGGAADTSAPNLAALSADDPSSGCPSIESFGIEAPPPGLVGERLEQFLKTQLE